MSPTHYIILAGEENVNPNVQALSVSAQAKKMILNMRGKNVMSRDSGNELSWKASAETREVQQQSSLLQQESSLFLAPDVVEVAWTAVAAVEERVAAEDAGEEKGCQQVGIIKIQSLFRGFSQKQAYRIFRTRLIKVQAAYRCFARYRQYKDLRIRLDVSLVKVQAFYRMVTQRNKYQLARNLLIDSLVAFRLSSCNHLINLKKAYQIVTFHDKATCRETKKSAAKEEINFIESSGGLFRITRSFYRKLHRHKNSHQESVWLTHRLGFPDDDYTNFNCIASPELDHFDTLKVDVGSDANDLLQAFEDLKMLYSPQNFEESEKVKALLMLEKVEHAYTTLCSFTDEERLAYSESVDTSRFAR